MKAGSGTGLPYYRQFPQAGRALTVATVACVVVSAALPMGFAVLSGIAVDRVPMAVRDGVDSPAGRRLLLAVGGVGVLFIVQQSLAPIQSAVTSVLGSRIRWIIYHRAMAAALRPPTVAHLESPELLNLLQRATGFTLAGPGRAVNATVALWTTRLTGAGALVVLASFRWWLAVMLLAALVHQARSCSGVYADLMHSQMLSGPALRRAQYLRNAAVRPEAAKEIRVFGLGEWVVRRFRSSWLAAMGSVWNSRRGAWSAFTTGLLPVVGVELLAFILLAGAVAAGSEGAGSAVVYAQAILAVAGLGFSGRNELYVSEGVARTKATIELDAVADALCPPPGQPPADRPLREIHFEQVSFRYAGQDRDVLHDLDLVVPVGRSLAIVGANGAGKTTLVKLLARLYDPTAGRLTVDGVDLRDLDATRWQRQFAAVAQDVVRYPLSAADNVAFGALDRLGDRAAIERAAAKAGALEVVERLPSGWETPLTREFVGGAELSGGEWQRIALARALSAVDAGARVLILDEPSAHLDVRAEAALYERFLELTRGLTTVLISHRLSSVRRADTIAVLDQGQVVESGAHDVLLAADGVYAAMFRLQAQRFAEEPASG